MENSQPLLWYGLLTLAVTGGLILIPNLRGRTSLISGWNIMLLGLAIFTGLGCLEAATTPIIRFPSMSWFQPTKAEVMWFMLTSTVFFAALMLTYYWNPLKSLTGRTFNNWPPQTTAVYLWVIGACLLVVLLVPLTMSSVFIGRVTMQLSHKAIVFATAFSFMLWFRHRMNVAWLALFIGTFLAALILAMLAGPTRRLFLSVFLAPVVYVYMAHMRAWRPTRAIVMISLAAAGLIVVGFMYNSVRRFDRDPWKERTTAGVIHEVRNIDNSWFRRLTSDTYRMMAQSNVQYALFTRREVESGRLESNPLNTLMFLMSYPVPRAIWPEKPSVIGVTIVRDVVGAKSTNWGVNIVGHVAYEGGMWVAALYGFLAAIGLRFLDDPLRRQPTNPFLVAVFAAAAPHILGWPRGDLGIMTTETAECFLFVIILSISARVLFGTEKNAQASRLSLPRTRAYQQSWAR
jgi:hypothetical protein